MKSKQVVTKKSFRICVIVFVLSNEQLHDKNFEIHPLQLCYEVKCEKAKHNYQETIWQLVQD